MLAVFGIMLTIGCHPTKYQYTYNLSKKELKKSEVKKDGSVGAEILAEKPLTFPSSQDLQITITNYNPIRDEIVVDDTSISFPPGDTASLARLIVFPTTPSVAEGDKKNAEIAVANGGVGASSARGMTSAGQMVLSVFAPPALAAKRNDCGVLEAYMYDFNLKKDEIEGLIDSYKDLMSKMEIITDDYQYLKTLDVLNTGDVTTRLSNSFIPRLNVFLPVAERVNANPTLVSTRVLAHLETKYFNRIIDAEAELDDIKKDADQLKGGCSGYIDLYKKFITAIDKVKNNLRDFKTAHTDKILPAFGKTLGLYDNLSRYFVTVPSYTTKAVSINEDFHTLNIYLKEANGIKKLHDQINIVPDHGFQKDIAGGFFVSGLYDESYSKKTMDSIYTKQYLVNGILRDTTVLGTFTTLYKKKQLSASYGGMLFFRFYTQNNQWANFGGYLGFGALFNDQTRWAGSLGISVVVGKRKKIVGAHLGIIASQVDRLTEPYQTDTRYSETIDNIPTHKALNANVMFGLSFKF